MPTIEIPVAYDAAIPSFSMEGLPANAVKSLLIQLYNVQHLLNKATNSHFSISERVVLLCSSSKETKLYPFLHQMLSSIQEQDISGIDFHFEDNLVIFNGFFHSDEKMEQDYFYKLGKALIEYSCKHHYSHVKMLDEQNERYSYANWLSKIGARSWKEYKTVTVRHRSRLEGSSAFRTKMSKERWTAKRKKDRLELKTLRKENLYLKQLLDSHAISYSESTI